MRTAVSESGSVTSGLLAKVHEWHHDGGSIPAPSLETSSQTTSRIMGVLGRCSRRLAHVELAGHHVGDEACAGQADQDGRPSGAALPAIDLSVVRGVGSSTVVRGSVGSHRPVIAGNAPIDTGIGVGFYTRAEAARIARIPRRTLNVWRQKRIVMESMEWENEEGSDESGPCPLTHRPLRARSPRPFRLFQQAREGIRPRRSNLSTTGTLI